MVIKNHVERQTWKKIQEYTEKCIPTEKWERRNGSNQHKICYTVFIIKMVWYWYMNRPTKRIDKKTQTWTQVPMELEYMVNVASQLLGKIL